MCKDASKDMFGACKTVVHLFQICGVAEKRSVCRSESNVGLFYFSDLSQDAYSGIPNYKDKGKILIH